MLLLQLRATSAWTQWTCVSTAHFAMISVWWAAHRPSVRQITIILDHVRCCFSPKIKKKVKSSNRSPLTCVCLTSQSKFGFASRSVWIEQLAATTASFKKPHATNCMYPRPLQANQVQRDISHKLLLPKFCLKTFGYSGKRSTCCCLLFVYQRISSTMICVITVTTGVITSDYNKKGYNFNIR